jgi:YesN/AraC family two-component response regulator
MDFNCYADFFDTLENKESNRYALQAGFYSVIALLVKNTEFKDRNEKLHSFIEASIDYLDKNFDKEPNISSLARMLGYDAHYCSCLFNKTYGKNFPTMINEYRIAKAQHLLQAGRLSMTEIAESCGFNCIRSFNRNFLKVTGCAPREFIKR